jgi:hypothetical protein
MGTPASISASEPPHTEAIDELPFDSRISDTTRMVYGKVFSSGSTTFRARSARWPWPVFAAAGAAQGLGLAGRERREVVVKHEGLLEFLAQTSMCCASCLVPSVVVTSAWVSPRVNSAEPCVRGSRLTSEVMAGSRRWPGRRCAGRSSAPARAGSSSSALTRRLP